MRVRVNGDWKEVESARVRVGGAWKQVSSVRVYVGGAWKDAETFVPALSVTTTGDEYVSRLGPGTVTTAPVTATPSGGLSPYTYAWTRVSGVGIINSPTSATTTFSHTLSNGDDVEGIFRVTVTDGLSSTATANVLVQFVSIDISGGA